MLPTLMFCLSGLKIIMIAITEVDLMNNVLIHMECRKRDWLAHTKTVIDIKYQMMILLIVKFYMHVINRILTSY